MRIPALVAWSVAICPAMATADAPAKPPKDERYCSPNGRFCAEAGVKERKTTVYEQCAEGEQVALWSADRWLGAQLTNDGQRIVDSVSNLIGSHSGPPTFEYPTGVLGESLFTIYGPSGRVANVSLSSLVDRPEDLLPTVSHFTWGNVGLDERDVIVAEVDACKSQPACPFVAYFDGHDGSRISAEQAAQKETTLPPSRCGQANSAGCMGRCTFARESSGALPWLLVLGLSLLRARGTSRRASRAGRAAA